MQRLTRRTLTIGAACAAAAVPVAAHAHAPGAVAHSAATRTVVLKGIAFTPRRLTIHKGGTVRWVWKDGSIAHNVTGKGFKSATITKGSFRHAFGRAGTFRYRCTIHPGMTATVIVR